MNNLPISDKIPELDIAVKAAQEASNVILDIYQKDYNTFTKTDDSPVTDADLKSNKIINEIEALPENKDKVVKLRIEQLNN